MATDYISAGLVCTCQVLILEFKQFNCLISFFSSCQELNVLSLFYVHRWPLLGDGSLFFLNQCSVFLFSPLQGILFHPTKETYRRAWHHKQGWLAPHSQAILTILIVLMWKYPLFVVPQDGERIAFDWFALCAWLRLPLGQDHPWRPLQIWKLVSCNGNLNRNMVFDKIGFSRIKITATNETRQTPKKTKAVYWLAWVHEQELKWECVPPFALCFQIQICKALVVDNWEGPGRGRLGRVHF